MKKIKEVCTGNIRRAEIQAAIFSLAGDTIHGNKAIMSNLITNHGMTDDH